MKLTPRVLTIADVLHAGPCFDPIEESRFSLYQLELNTTFNVFDIEKAYTQGLIDSLSLAWLTYSLELFLEPNWRFTVYSRMAEVMNRPLRYDETAMEDERGIGIFDNEYISDSKELEIDRAIVDYTFFQVVHEMANGQPLFDWGE